MLPILTFDADVLAPSLGYVFSPKWVGPYESIVAILWKFARANALAGHIVVGQLSDAPIDVYAGIAAAPALISIPKVARMLGLRQRVIRTGLIHDAFPHHSHPALRWCSKCIARGYHSVVHQRATLARCPMHDQPLEDRCRHCGFTNPYRLCTRMLDAPFRCPDCRRTYAGVPWSAYRIRRWTSKDRTAMTRAALHR